MGDKQKNLVIKFLKKMKNGIHLDVAEFSKLKPNYLKSVKKVVLGKHFQVSGYFSLKQTSFLWIVYRECKTAICYILEACGGKDAGVCIYDENA